jgi:hypothetical protein
MPKLAKFQFHAKITAAQKAANKLENAFRVHRFLILNLDVPISDDRSIVAVFAQTLLLSSTR